MKKMTINGVDLLVGDERIDTEFGSIDHQFVKKAEPGDSVLENLAVLLKDSVDYYFVTDFIEGKIGSGKVIKTDNIKQFDLGERIYFDQYKNTAKDHIKAVYNWDLTPKPKDQTPKKQSSNKGRKQRPLTTVNGKLSDAGYAYFKDKMDKLIQRDPANMAEALWRIRKEIKQRPRDLNGIIDDVAQIYRIDRNLLESRNRSRMAFWSYAKRK
jgi:hypothetical protein